MLARPRGRVINTSPGGRIPEHLPPAGDDARAAPALVPEDFLIVDEVAASSATILRHLLPVL